MLTIVANDIVHVASRRVTVLARVEHDSATQNTRQTADGTQPGRTTTHDNHIVVRGGGRSSQDSSQKREARVDQ